MSTNSSEFDYYQMNFKSILNNSKSCVEINEIASYAVHNRQDQKTNFEQRLLECSNKFEHGDYSITPIMQGWDKEYLMNFINKFGGVLCALFHFGSHRHFFLDAASLNIPTVAPVAGKSYSDMQNLISKSSNELASRVKLLEVEDEKVSLELIRNLKEKKVGGIYVDGNMGPNSASTNMDGSKVNFLGFDLAVKTGIARIAILLKLPIVPVFCKKENGIDTIKYGKAILPKTKYFNKKNETNNIMQHLYDSLEYEVLNSPHSWEYALCLHRWIIPRKTKEEKKSITETATIEVNKKNLSIIHKDGIPYWFNALTTNGLKIPKSLNPIFSQFLNAGETDWKPISLSIEKAGYNSKKILNQLNNAGLVNVFNKF